MLWFVLGKDQRLFALNKATLTSTTGQYQIAVFAWYVCLFVCLFVCLMVPSHLLFVSFLLSIILEI